MMSNSTPSTDVRCCKSGRTFLVRVFALMMTALLVIAARAQDNRARQDRGSPAALPRLAESPQRAGPNAPAGGEPHYRLTLDQAVDRLERANLTLAAMRLEVVQARADVVIAGQRPNSLRFIGGGQEGLVRLRMLDIPPKLWIRALAAHLAARVTEAQYRDAVRTQTANLYTAYVDVQEAQEQTQFARASLTGFEHLVSMTKLLAETGQLGKTDLGRTAAAQARASLAATDSDVALRKARLTLADLLNVPDVEAERLEASAETDKREPVLPAVEELTRLALGLRPDLRAYRLGGLWGPG
jgi:outer membrane protein TolC